MEDELDPIPGLPESRAACRALDLDDPLGGLRDQFALPEGTLYFDGNSLGPVTHGVVQAMRRVTEEQWGRDLISSWNTHGWIDWPERLGAKIAPLLGAAADEVVVCDSVSVNLFKLLSAALDLRPGRRAVLCQADHFPTDRYIAQGLVDRLGGDYRLVPFAVDALDAALDAAAGEAAAVCLSHVDFRSGRLEDMAELTALIHRAGALAVWDLSHSAGAVPVALGECGVDMAVGCGYKFLNGGPGAPSFLAVARRHHGELRTPIQGWLGHRQPFDFSPKYAPAEGVLRFVAGTPPILAMAALSAALDIFDDVKLEALRAKSVALSELMIERVERRCPGVFELISPRSAVDRGSQVTWRHPKGFAIVQALIARGVVGDFRAPDLLRFGVTPLYQRYVDVWDAVEALGAVLDADEHLDPRFERRGRVT
ncbi:MAG: kynureninase [Acidobacteriota bacterium]